MAFQGYWQGQFIKGAAEACAITYLDNMPENNPVKIVMNEVLVGIGPLELAKITNGDWSKEKVAKVIVRRMDLVNSCISKLGSGLMAPIITSALECKVLQDGSGIRAHSDKLEEAFTKLISNKLHHTWWWKVERKAFMAQCREIRAIQSVHIS